MKKRISLSIAKDILGISSDNIKKALENGDLQFFTNGVSNRKYLTPEAIENFTKSRAYQKLKKNTGALIYLRCLSRSEQKKKDELIRIYCDKNNIPAVKVYELVRPGIPSSTQAFEKAFEYLYNRKVNRLIYDGDTEDVEDLKKCFKALNFQVQSYAEIITSKEAKAQTLQNLQNNITAKLQFNF